MINQFTINLTVFPSLSLLLAREKTITQSWILKIIFFFQKPWENIFITRFSLFFYNIHVILFHRQKKLTLLQKYCMKLFVTSQSYIKKVITCD